MGKLRHRKGKQLIRGCSAQKMAELGFESSISLPHPSPQCVLASKPRREPVLRRRGTWLIQETEYYPSSQAHLLSPLSGAREVGEVSVSPSGSTNKQSTTVYGITDHNNCSLVWGGDDQMPSTPWRGVSVMERPYFQVRVNSRGHCVTKEQSLGVLTFSFIKGKGLGKQGGQSRV